MITLYAPTDTGKVIGLCGNEFKITGGIIEVNAQDVDGLLANGFMLANPPADEVSEPVEEVKKPARKKKESAE